MDRHPISWHPHVLDLTSTNLIQVQPVFGLPARPPSPRVSCGIRAPRRQAKNALVFLLESPGFAQNFGSCGEVEGLHLVGVLTFGDEFREMLVWSGFNRNSGRRWRSAVATTSSEGRMPGRMVRNQDPKEFQTSWGYATAR